MYFVIAAIGEMRVNREDIVGLHSEEVKENQTLDTSKVFTIIKLKHY